MRNYIRVAFICIVTVVIVIALGAIYDTYQKYDLNIPIIRGTLKELKPNDLDNYISENDYTLLYVCVATDDNCRKLEKKLKDVLKERRLTEEIIYLNITEEDSYGEYLNKLNTKYSKDIVISNYPALIIFENQKMVGIVEKNGNQYLNVGDIEQFLDVNEIRD